MRMKFKYLYQQFFSHLIVVFIAFLILSLLFSQFMEQFVYNNKTEELLTYGENILYDVEQSGRSSHTVLGEYSTVLRARDIQFSLFNEQAILIYSAEGTGPKIQLTDAEWEKITNGEVVVVRQDVTHFDVAVTYVLLPYFHNLRFVGGILLASPITGISQAIGKINQNLFYAVLIALLGSLLLSWLLAIFHVNRIKRIRTATSKVAMGDYTIQIPTSQFDEIGELAGDFNKMVSKLHMSMEEIESLENRRRKFMADVSHELRTPLTTINGVIEGIETGMISESEQNRAMKLVSKESKRLIRLVNENLDYEKIRSNQVVLHKEEIELTEMLEIVKDQLEILAADKGNILKVDVPGQTFILADYDRLTQILINIIKNSIQFTENGEITLRGRMENEQTIIEIVDTGVGINPQDIEKIWHRFYKAGLSRSNNPYGEFGLGLAIVKQLVKLHDGEIIVSSVAGEGTQFTILFPYKSSNR